jgi:nitrogen-specific signal transduction histidine kinase
MPSTNVTNLPFLLWLTQAPDWHVTECSDALLQACAYAGASLIGAPLAKLIGSSSADEIKKWSESKSSMDTPLQMPAILNKEDGGEIFVELSIAYIKNSTPPRFAFIASADTPQMSLEPKIAMATADHAKFDALAVIAQGMGHEINNPLQIILGNAEHLQLLTQDPALLSVIHDILSAGERIKFAVANLKDFVRTEEK